jgi:hypothetical protein
MDVVVVKRGQAWSSGVVWHGRLAWSGMVIRRGRDEMKFFSFII